MSQTRTLPDGTIQRKVRWQTCKRKTSSRQWKSKWVIVERVKTPDTKKS